VFPISLPHPCFLGKRKKTIVPYSTSPSLNNCQIVLFVRKYTHYSVPPDRDSHREFSLSPLFFPREAYPSCRRRPWRSGVRRTSARSTDRLRLSLPPGKQEDSCGVVAGGAGGGRPVLAGPGVPPRQEAHLRAAGGCGLAAVPRSARVHSRRRMWSLPHASASTSRGLGRRARVPSPFAYRPTSV